MERLYKPIVIPALVGALIGGAVVWVGMTEPQVAPQKSVAEVLSPNLKISAMPTVLSEASRLEHKISELGAEIQQLKLIIEQSVDDKVPDSHRELSDDTISTQLVNVEGFGSNNSPYSEDWFWQ